MFQNKTVDSVISTFTKAIKDLAQIEEAQATESLNQRLIARKADEAADVALDESQRAASVAKKIAALVE